MLQPKHAHDVALACVDLLIPAGCDRDVLIIADGKRNRGRVDGGAQLKLP
jgi:hypothetical protein